MVPPRRVSVRSGSPPVRGVDHRSAMICGRPDEEERVEIDGKGAVVVGGASGMARASAEQLRAKGAKVAILDLPTSKGEEVAKALDGTFHPVDVTDADAVEAALNEAVDALGDLWIAVNT